MRIEATVSTFGLVADLIGGDEEGSWVLKQRRRTHAHVSAFTFSRAIALTSQIPWYIYALDIKWPC